MSAAAHHGEPIDMVGWSRGCFEASRLAQLLADGIPDHSRQPQRVVRTIQDGHGRSHTVTDIIYPKFFPAIRYMALISPVNQMGISDWLGAWPRSLPGNVEFLYEAGDSNPGHAANAFAPASASRGYWLINDNSAN